MRIIRARVLGFCFGVRRAIELAEAARADGGGLVQSLGPLVHNPQEIERLERMGIHAIAEMVDVTTPAVVIRAHGARPEQFTALQRRGIRVVDATCPFVTKSQQLAGQLTTRGYTLVIIGHPAHPEVQGILGYAVSPAYVISQPAEVTGLPAGIRPGVIAQTTVNEQTFSEVAAAITARYPEAVVHDTVCSATRQRQESAKALATEVQAIYVIGGRQSSNTNRLAEICRATCARTFLIESAREIDPLDLVEVECVGVTAGASTPDRVIDEVIARLTTLAWAEPASL